MRHRSSDFQPPNDPSGESDVDGISIPKGRKFLPLLRIETPAEEMGRLIRVVAGNAAAGEKDYQLIARAARRMNVELKGNQQIGERRARAYWYSEIEDVPSHHMDRARELTFLHPIDEAINAIEAVQAYLNTKLERLLDEVTGVHVDHGRAAARGRIDASNDRPSRLSLAGKSRRAAVPSNPASPGALNLSSLRRLTAD